MYHVFLSSFSDFSYILIFIFLAVLPQSPKIQQDVTVFIYLLPCTQKYLKTLLNILKLQISLWIFTPKFLRLHSCFFVVVLLLVLLLLCQGLCGYYVCCGSCFWLLHTWALLIHKFPTFLLSFFSIGHCYSPSDKIVKPWCLLRGLCFLLSDSPCSLCL